jgi:hypothetical protein
MAVFVKSFFILCQVSHATSENFLSPLNSQVEDPGSHMHIAEEKTSVPKLLS